MADQNLVAAGGNSSAAASWESVPLLGNSSGPPAAADDVYMLLASGDILIDATTNQWGSWAWGTYTGIIAFAAGQDILSDSCVSGPATLTGSGDIHIGDDGADINDGLTIDSWLGSWVFDGGAGSTGVLTAGNDDIGDVDIQTAGATSFTLGSDVHCSDLTLTSGVLNISTYDLYCDSLDSTNTTVTGSGDFVIGSGGFTYSGGTWSSFTGRHVVAASCTGDWNNGGQRMQHLVINEGVTLTSGGLIYTEKATLTGNLSMAHILDIRSATSSWWGVQTGTATLTQLRMVFTNVGPGNDVTLATGDVLIQNTNGNTLTWDANLTTTEDFYIYSANNGTMTTDFAGYSLSARDLIIGHVSQAARYGAVYLGEGTHTLRNINSNTASGGILAFETSHINLSGTLDGSDLTCSSDGIAYIRGGTVEKVTMSSGKLYCYGSTDGGGNDANVIFVRSGGGALLMMRSK